MLHIIINPSSSAGRGQKKWNRIEKLFREEGALYEVHRVSRSNPIEDVCAALTSSGEECTIVVVGGDGSMNGVVNGIRDFEKTKVGLIPMGSGNDLALDLELSGNLPELVRSIVRKEVVRECDIGRVTFHNSSEPIDPFTHRPYTDDPESHKPTFRLFNISAGIGFDAACCQMAEASRSKKILNRVGLGKLIYIYSAVRLILTAPMEPAKITMQDPSRDEDKSRVLRHFLFAVGMNHRYEGGGFRFCPSASDSDGLLDSCIAGDLHRLNFFRIFPTAYKGNHLRFKGVDDARSKSITIRTKIPLWVHTDGEVPCKSSHITIDLLEEKLRMIV